MNADESSVFFYGLFMDESLLAAKGIEATAATIGYVDGYSLSIGKRATLIPEPGGRAYGVLMTVGSEDIAALYSDASVADYVAEPVAVSLPDGSEARAVCYNLPAAKLAGANPEYAATLLALARQLEFPESYLGHIENSAGLPGKSE